MGGTCTSVVSWIANLSVNWDAWSALGTIAATVVALFLPFRMARREWARQDLIRQADADRIKQQNADVQHEVCSAVDRVLAYRDAAIAIFGSEPVYLVGIQAVRRINLNAAIQLEVLGLLVVRSGLSDGTLYSAVAAKNIAKDIVDETGKVVAAWGVIDPRWPERKSALEELNQLASLAQQRSSKVRKHYGIDDSQTAEAIRQKYIPLAQAIIEARTADSGEPANNLAESHF